MNILSSVYRHNPVSRDSAEDRDFQVSLLDEIDLVG